MSTPQVERSAGLHSESQAPGSGHFLPFRTMGDNVFELGS